MKPGKKSGWTLLACLVIYMTTQASIPLLATQRTLLPQPLPAHPRLMAKPGDWERIRKNIKEDQVSAAIYQSLQRKADHLLTEPPLKRVMIGRRLLEVSRQVLDRVSVLAMVALVSGDEKYSRRAIEEMMAAADFTDWNPSHFLDTAEMSLALAIGYDWLFDKLSPAEKEKISIALVEKGLNPSLEQDRGDIFVGRSNWNQVCNAGLSAAAIAMADREPVLAEKILDRAVAGIVNVGEAYAPDGAYQEGPMYWAYGTSFHVILADALLRLTGSTQGIDKLPGFAASAEYMTQVTMPNGEFFSYADARQTRPILVPLFWFARDFHRPDWLNLEEKRLADNLKAYDRGDGERTLALALLWRDPGVEAMAHPPLHWIGRGLQPVAIHRSSFSDPDALYFGIKGGSPGLPHAHMDVGSFVLEADGQVWAADLGMQEYESLEKENVALWDGSPGGDRWKVFRLGPESHNILRFDDCPQLVGERADFVLFRSEGEFPCSVLDLTGLYHNRMESVQRGVMFVQNKAVLLQDEWMTAEKAVETDWQMLTAAKVAVDGKGTILLSRNGKQLRLQILNFDPATMSVKVEDAEKLRNALDTPNPGYSRIRIRVSTGPKSRGMLRVLAVPGSSGTVAPPGVRNLSGW